jgi:hypothetical protein
VLLHFSFTCRTSTHTYRFTRFFSFCVIVCSRLFDTPFFFFVCVACVASHRKQQRLLFSFLSFSVCGVWVLLHSRFAFSNSPPPLSSSFTCQLSAIARRRTSVMDSSFCVLLDFLFYHSLLVEDVFFVCVCVCAGAWLRKCVYAAVYYSLETPKNKSQRVCFGVYYFSSADVPTLRIERRVADVSSW